MISWKPKPLQSMTESERDELFDSVFPIMLNEIDERDTPAMWIRSSGDLEAWREHIGEECWTYVPEIILKNTSKTQLLLYTTSEAGMK